MITDSKPSILPSVKRLNSVELYCSEYVMNARFVYQAFDLTGEYDWVYDQTLYSIFSLFTSHGWTELPAGTSVTVFTDRPERFEPLTELLDIQLLDEERILRGMGSTRFIHRLKLDLLAQAADGTTVPLIYLDGDTWLLSSFESHLRSISPSVSLMHTPESRVSEVENTVVKKAVGQIPQSYLPSGYQPESTMLYNAGLIGLHPSQFSLIDDAIRLTDCGTEFGYSHVWEQFAVSVMLDNATQVAAADDVVFHYWSQREQYNAMISELLGAIRARGLEAESAIHYVQENPISILSEKRVSSLKRVWKRALGQSKVVAARMQDSINAVQASRKAS
ncbi:MAG: hypothetical protein ABJZ55_19985 [Fuerstiella sp.]